MSDAVIRVPFRSRGDSLADVADAARALPAGEDRAVARGLILEAAESGMSTAGQVLDHLDGLDPAGRRALLDRTRQRAGLPSLAEVAAEQRRAYQRPMVGTERRDADGRAFQVCPQPDCRAYPVDETSGAPIPVAAKRWWCEAHRDGHETDMVAWSSSLRIAASGALELGDEVELETHRQQLEAERRAADRDLRRAAAQAQWKASKADREAERRALVPDNFRFGAPT